MDTVALFEKLAHMPEHCSEQVKALMKANSSVYQAFMRNAGSDLRDQMAKGKYLPHATFAANV